MTGRLIDGHGRGRQCAALPLTWQDGEARVLLVTSRGTGRWVLPKGWAEKGLTASALAAKEAYEEAGVVGDVAPEALGSYRYFKRLTKSRTLECEVHVFPLTLRKLLKDWPERRQRKRHWFTLGRAAMTVDEGDLASLLLTVAASGMVSMPVPLLADAGGASLLVAG